MTISNLVPHAVGRRVFSKRRISACVIPVVFQGMAAAEVVNANFTSATTIPVTAAGYTAAGNTVNPALNFAPPVGTNLTVVNNTGVALIQGTFANLAQWQVVGLTFGGIDYPFVANYGGGDGNDLVLEWAGKRLVAWGYNTSGQLGIGTQTERRVPTPVIEGVLAGKVVARTAAGGTFSLALCTDGTLAAWGGNTARQLGNGPEPLNWSLIPTLVDRSGVLAGKTITVIAAGANHSLALCSDGVLVAWGHNDSGQLGDGSTVTPVRPVLVVRSGILAGKTIKAISAGGNHSLALCTDGTLVAWGSNYTGQCGDGSIINRLLPVRVTQTGVLSGKTVTAISAGAQSSMARCSDGNLATWGYGTYGALGNGSTVSYSATPVLVSRSGVLSGKAIAAISCGAGHCLALCTDGSLAGWGGNFSSEIGNLNAQTYHTTPVLTDLSGVLVGRPFIGVAAGGDHSVGWDAEGIMAAWGDNRYGETGDGSQLDRRMPALVSTASLKSGERFLSASAGGAHNLALIATAPPPMAETLAATAITGTSVTLNARAYPNGNATNVSFEYGTTPAYGTTVSAAPATVSGTTATGVSRALAGLAPGTTYHYRVVVASASHSVTGADQTFTTLDEAMLAGLSMTGGQLQPGFEPQRLLYAATVSSTTAGVTLTPQTRHAEAMIRVNGEPVGSGAASPELPLATGDNTLEITVTGATGDSLTYRVVVLRLPAVFEFSSPTAVTATAAGFDLNGDTAEFALRFAPTPGTRLMVLQNTGTGLIRGRFANLRQWQIVSLSFGGLTYSFVANYFGGTGNDLVLEWANRRLIGWGSIFGGQLAGGGLSPVAVETGVLAGRKMLAAGGGGAHSVALAADGMLAAWGANDYGQLGDSTRINRIVPAPVDASGVLAGGTIIAVAARGGENLALLDDGTLAGWGGGYGLTPVPVARDGALANKVVIRIAMGTDHALALCEDGTLAAWGKNIYGQLGDGSNTDRTSPVLVNRTGVLAGKTVTGMAGGTNFSVVVCADGTLAAWGRGAYGQLGNGDTAHASVPVAVDRTGVLAGKTPTAVAAGITHCLALCAEGDLVSWGGNHSGQLGGQPVTSTLTPGLVTRSGVLAGKTVVEIAAGSEHCVVRCSDGTLAAWGASGTVGDGQGQTRYSPVLVNLAVLRPGERCTRIVTGSTHSLALVDSPLAPAAETFAASELTDSSARLNGAVNAMGAATAVSFEYGLTTGYGSTVAAVPGNVSEITATPVSVALSGLLAGLTYHYRVVAAGPGGTITGADATFTTTTTGTLAALTLSAGSLTPAFDPNTEIYQVTVNHASDALTVTPTSSHPAAALTVAGVPVTSGVASQSVSLAEGSTAVSVAVTAPGGSVRTYQLSVLRLPAVMAFDSAASVPAVAPAFSLAGLTAAIALNFAPAPGTALTLLDNTGNRPIDGHFSNLAHGQQVALQHDGATYPLVANYHGGTGNDLVLEWAMRRVVAWGYNETGGVGDGSTINRLLPVPVATGALAGKSVLRIAAGRFHTLALTTDGTLVGWGSNGSGQLGNGGLGTALQPVAVDLSGVLAGKAVVAIAAGENHSMALCADGTLAAWGSNVVGQLGDGTTTNRTRPTAVTFPAIFAGKAVAAIACGRSHNVAIFADGTLAAWGYNTDGGLGDGTTTHRSLPVPVKQTGVLAGKTPIAVACGTSHSLALCADGTLAAWGGGSFGQLGDGFIAYQRTTPVLVNRSGALAGKTVTAIAAGAQHSLALCADGTIAAWGDNHSGQLGIPGSSTEARATPTLVRTDTALAGKLTQSVTAAGGRSMAVTRDGTLAAWGVNYYGQLGDGTTTARRSPTAVSSNALIAGERFAAISAGEFHSVALVASLPPPVATTLAAANVAATTATLQGSVNPAGGSVTVMFEYGLTAAYGTTAAATPATVAGTTAGAGCALTGLTAGAVYHYRIVATGPHGTAYGQDLTFTTTHLPLFGGYAVSTPWQTAVSIPLRKILSKASDPDGDPVTVIAAGPATANGGTALMQASAIRYTPPGGFYGADSFPVTITDSGGAAVTGTVTVTVGPGPTAGGIGSNPPKLTVLPGGKMGIAFQGIPGRSYTVQRSVGGLDDWETLATVTADAAGKVAFTDDNPPPGSAYYRLGLP